jgi:KaiC/GvpD/RAD55 family RecA-like ATPase
VHDEGSRPESNESAPLVGGPPPTIARILAPVAPDGPEHDARVSSGTKGLDGLLGGGIPQGHVLCVMGSFGTGKTTLAIQFLAEGIRLGEHCVFVTLDEEADRLIETAERYGHDIRTPMSDGRLAILKLSPVDARATLRRVNSDLLRFLKESHATRVVLDSATLLSSVFDSEVDRRSVLFELGNAIRQAGATAIFTAEVAPGGNALSSRDGIVEYVSDGVVALRYAGGVTPDTSLDLEMVVLKLRRSSHSRKIARYEITEHGIQLVGW